jgi:hypothetical protein
VQSTLSRKKRCGYKKCKKKPPNKTSKEGRAEEIDNFLSTVIATGNYLEPNIELMDEAIQSACRRTFQQSHTINNNSKTKSVPWWSVGLTAMRKKVNANRRLYQRTRSDEALRERRKATYMVAKRRYQAEIKKAKSTSWKEFCNVAASINPLSQVYKLAAGKTRTASIMATIRKHDGTETPSLHETS